MALRTNEAYEDVYNSGSGLSWNAFTMMAWVLVDADRAANSYIFEWTGGGSGGWVAVNSSRVVFVEGTSQVNGTTALTVGAWYHIAMTVGPSYVTAYVNGAYEQQAAVSSFTPSVFSLGGYNEWFNGRFAALKVFGSVLTADQIKAEMGSYRPVAAAWAWYPLFGALTDFSGNGRTLTSNGTAGWEDGPPVLWGGVKHVIGPATIDGSATLPGIFALTGDGSLAGEYGWPLPHSGVWPFSSVWRPARM